MGMGRQHDRLDSVQDDHRSTRDAVMLLYVAVLVSLSPQSTINSVFVRDVHMTSTED